MRVRCLLRGISISGRVWASSAVVMLGTALIVYAKGAEEEDADGNLDHIAYGGDVDVDLRMRMYILLAHFVCFRFVRLAFKAYKMRCVRRRRAFRVSAANYSMVALFFTSSESYIQPSSRWSEDVKQVSKGAFKP